MVIDTLLVKRLLFAAVSGMGVGMLQFNENLFGFPGGTPAFYGASGVVFAAGVLFPYLQGNDRALIRALMLSVSSGLSYFVAVRIALDGPNAGDLDWIWFTIASVAGAAIVMTAFLIATPARATRRYATLGVIAGLIGGPVTVFTLPTEALLPVLSGHAAWHMLIGAAIHYGTMQGQSRTSE